MTICNLQENTHSNIISWWFKKLNLRSINDLLKDTIASWYMKVMFNPSKSITYPSYQSGSKAQHCLKIVIDCFALCHLELDEAVKLGKYLSLSIVSVECGVLSLKCAVVTTSLTRRITICLQTLIVSVYRLLIILIILSSKNISFIIITLTTSQT